MAFSKTDSRSPNEDKAIESAHAGDAGEAANQLFDTVAEELSRTGPRMPLSTYRVQLNKEFRFDDARAIVDYLDALGVGDLYTSPFFKARPESMHGYDIVDHSTLNPELGDRQSFNALAERLAGRDMGLLVDTVPNHMGIGAGWNGWWLDVLENGPSSLYAHYFDIDWHPLKTELENKVLLPVLGDHYGRVLERGELKLRYEGGGFFVDYYEWRLPLNPRTYSTVLEPMVPPLVEQLGEDADPVLELQSIITGLGHLPPRTETRRPKVIERHREKEILKRRLATLVAETPIVKEQLDARIALLNGKPGEPRSFDALDALLEAQAYRLSFFRVAAEEINYRRFFDVNDLAAIRMENPKVFAEAHRLLVELLGEGRITGLRIDHPDGLWDPGAYLLNLQRSAFLELCRRRAMKAHRSGESDREREKAEREEFDRLKPKLLMRWDEARLRDPRSPVTMPIYLVVEKILARGEVLPDDWPVHGTVGYDFGAIVGGLFVDRSSERALTEVYARFTDSRPHFDLLAYEKKKQILQTSLASELNVLAHALNRLAEQNRYSRDFTLGTLTHALREVIASFPVYRTYVNERTEGISPRDRQVIERAIRLARRRSPSTDPSVYHWLRALLTLDLDESSQSGTDAEEARAAEREFVMKFQQLTAPVTAKGIEDTAFYVYHRLVSLNEVGGEPERFGSTLTAFHESNQKRLAQFPASLVSTSTHDTKRSEDVRARISVISEIPEQWESALSSFSYALADAVTDLDGEAAPDRNDQYLLFQTLLGTFPFKAPEGAALEEYAGRIVRYMGKAMKEAKVNTSWISPNTEYEAAMERLIRAALDPSGKFMEHFAPLARLVAFHGMWGSLSQLLLKLTAPGVPDIYQGNELWDFSLVDPDNRRAIDYGARRRLLAEMLAHREPDESRIDLARELVRTAEDGRIKLYVTHAALKARRAQPEPFVAGSTYEAIAAEGSRAEHVVAFARRARGRSLEFVTVAPRWTARLAGGERRAPMGALWEATHIKVGEGRYRNLFTGETLAAERGTLPLARVLAVFPVALLRRLE